MRTRSQRLLSMVLALSMLLTFLPVSAFADDTPPSYAVSNADPQPLDPDNTYTYNGNTYTYKLNGTTATLTQFTGTNADVPSSVTANDGKPYTVTAIGKNAFATMDSSDKHQKNEKLQSVNLPNTITEIGDHAFFYCQNDNFTSIKIPDGVTEIKAGTFGNCTHLEDVTLPKDLITIGEGAFSDCSALHSIKLPEGLTTVKDAAFHGAKLETIDWPKSLTTVGVFAFQNATNVTPGASKPTSSTQPIKTITYPGTETDWQRLLNRYTDGGYTVAATNPQLVPKNTENAEGVDLHCAHTVTFNANGHGTDPDNQVVDKQVVEYEGHASKPSDPTADGYTFKYWFTTSENGEEKEFDFNTEIIEDTELFAHWEEKTTPEKPSQPTTPEQPGTQQPGTTTPTTPPESTDKPTDKPNEPNPPQNPDDNKPGTPEKPNEPTTPEAPTVEEDDTAAIGYAAAAVTAAFVGWGAYRIGSEVYLKYLLPNDVLLPQNRLQLAKLLWEDAGRPAPADAAAYADVDANDADARQAARWAVENGLLTLPDTEKPEEFAPYRSVSYAKSARAWNQAQQLKETTAAH